RRDGRGLDRRRGFVADGGQCLQQRLRQAEIGEQRGGGFGTHQAASGGPYGLVGCGILRSAAPSRRQLVRVASRWPSVTGVSAPSPGASSATPGGRSTITVEP